MSNKTTFAEIKATRIRNEIEYEMEQKEKMAYERECSKRRIIDLCKPSSYLKKLYENRPPELISFRSNYTENNIYTEYYDISHICSQHHPLGSFAFKSKREVKDMCNQVKKEYYKMFDHITDIKFECEKVSSIFGNFKGYDLVIKNENPYKD